MVFLRDELSWLCLVQFSTTLFLCFPMPLLHIDDATQKLTTVSPVPAYSSNCGSHDASAPDFTVVQCGSKSEKSDAHLLQFTALAQSVYKVDGHVQSISNAVVILRAATWC